MTQGERMIWAAAFIDSLRLAVDATTRAVEAGFHGPSNVPVRAAIDAARAVQMARRALPKLIDAPVKTDRPEWQTMRHEEIEMLREMLGAPEVKLR